MILPQPGLTGRTAAVLGAGRQGTCAAYDFARWGGAARLILVDARQDALDAAVGRLARLLPGVALERRLADGGDEAALARALDGAAAGVCALPYRYAPIAGRAAIAARCSLADLGGNTAISGQLLALHDAAVRAGIALIPDTGLAPGLANTLAADGIARLDVAREVRVWCGGLPQRKIPPLDYRLVFNVEGLLNEYSGHAVYLRGGRRIEVPALSDITDVELPGIGKLEAFPTSGGTSTAPDTFAGLLDVYEYRTVRYPGHIGRFRSLADLGLFSEEPVETGDGGRVRPRDLLCRILTTLLDHPEVPDLVVLRVEARGTRGGRPARIVYDMLDKEDAATGFTAMERTTAFPAAIVAEMAAAGEVAPGAKPLEVCAPPRVFLSRLAARPLNLVITEQ